MEQPIVLYIWAFAGREGDMFYIALLMMFITMIISFVIRLKALAPGG